MAGPHITHNSIHEKDTAMAKSTQRKCERLLSEINGTADSHLHWNINSRISIRKVSSSYILCPSFCRVYHLTFPTPSVLFDQEWLSYKIVDLPMIPVVDSLLPCIRLLVELVDCGHWWEARCPWCLGLQKWDLVFSVSYCLFCFNWRTWCHAWVFSISMTRKIPPISSKEK